MEFDQWLDEFKTVFRRSALPDTVRQNYEQILAFVDAHPDSEGVAEFSADLSVLLSCNLDLFFPVPESDERVAEPEELLSEQRYADVQERLRHYRRLEGNVTEAILDHAGGEGDETLCVFPAPFQLTADEDTDPGVPGDVLGTLLSEVNHPSFLVRDKPHTPPDLYEHVVVAGSTLHNLIRLIRCTAGVCPEDTTEIKVVAVADQRFVQSMKELLEETKDLESAKTGARMRHSLVKELRRKLRQLAEQLRDQHGIAMEHRILEKNMDEGVADGDLFDRAPSLLTVPTTFTGGGYDAAVLQPLFKRYTDTEILTI